jgi:hypothetical protein
VASGEGPERIRVLEPGDLFGEVGVEASEALVLTQAAFQRLRLTNPRLALRFVLDLGRILGERFRASDALAGPAPPLEGATGRRERRDEPSTGLPCPSARMWRNW